MFSAILLAASLSLPPLVHDTSLRVTYAEPAQRWEAIMTIDGVRTTAKWPEAKPRVHAFGDGRYLLHETYNENRIWVWNAKEKRLHDLGRGLLIETPKGWLVAMTDERSSSLAYHDVQGNALRLLWKEPRSSTTVVLGTTPDGGIELFSRGSDRSKPTLVTIHPDGTTKAKAVEFPDEAHIASAKRGTRVLVTMGRKEGPGLHLGSYGMPTVETDIGIYDFATKALRKIGTVQSCFTNYTAIPHPYFSLRWSDTPRRPERGGEFPCETIVDVSSEKPYRLEPFGALNGFDGIGH